MKIYLDQLLTSYNTPLWDKIKNKEAISIVLWENNFSELYTLNSLIEMRLSSLDINSFNHELCHIYLNQVCGGIFSNLNLRMPSSFYGSISRDCLLHIANCIEHKLFYNLYLEIGGEMDYFVSDYGVKKGHNLHQKINILNKSNIDPYLGCLSSVLGDCNPKINYENELAGYRKISNEIFQASVDLFDEIINIGITEQLEDFTLTEKGVVINKTHSNACEDFWHKINLD